MENMDVGLSTTVIGIAIVFAILILLALILSCFRIIFAGKKADSGQKPEARTEIIPPPTVLSAESDDTELIAVITAAVACCMNTPPDRIAVRSVRKASVSGWNDAAIRESMKYTEPRLKVRASSSQSTLTQGASAKN